MDEIKEEEQWVGLGKTRDWKASQTLEQKLQPLLSSGRRNLEYPDKKERNKQTPNYSTREKKRLQILV